MLSEHIGARIGRALGPAMSRDARRLPRRRWRSSPACHSRSDVFARPGFAERVFAAAAGATPASFGPQREELLTLLR